MNLTEEQQEKLALVAKPLIKYLAENHNPHTTVIVTSINAELLEAKANIYTKEFLID